MDPKKQKKKIFWFKNTEAINELIAINADLLLKDPSYLDVLNEQFEVNGRKGNFEVTQTCPLPQIIHSVDCVFI